MQDVFQRFAEKLAKSADATGLHDALAETASSLGLPFFAYLSPSLISDGRTNLISTYPNPWTSHYFDSQYEKVDPVILRARSSMEAFSWHAKDCGLDLSLPQQRLMQEATQFGIRSGFTVPIYDNRGRFAALTFASDERPSLFFRAIERYQSALQLIAIFFHLHARLRLAGGRMVDGVSLSRREIECLRWAAEGKSAWEIGRIVGITERTAAFHRDNARKKLGVRTVTQAAVLLALSRPWDFI